jgi:hypothetical protein
VVQICTVAIRRQRDSVDADGFLKSHECGTSNSNTRTTASVVSSDQALAVIAANKAASTRSNSEVLPDATPSFVTSYALHATGQRPTSVVLYMLPAVH